MKTSVEWYVRVWVGKEESDDPAYETALYIARCSTPAEAEAAIKRFRSKDDERMEVLKGVTVPGTGSQLQPGEVQRVRGAV